RHRRRSRAVVRGARRTRYALSRLSAGAGLCHRRHGLPGPRHPGRASLRACAVRGLQHPRQHPRRPEALPGLRPHGADRPVARRRRGGGHGHLRQGLRPRTRYRRRRGHRRQPVGARLRGADEQHQAGRLFPGVPERDPAGRSR
ncbi:hypothetical protein OY671_013141, partial [Metschnikowia pulcherrima]